MKGKKILLGITGSIAAYKSISLTRLLVKAGAEVQVVCSPAALDFVTPLTLSTLSKRPVVADFVVDRESGEWTNHVALGKWADLMLIAPLSANTLSKMCAGACDNLLLATYLSAPCPIMVAPAMDLDMYQHWTTRQNLDLLIAKGVKVLDSPAGELASGLRGAGRMEEPEEIFDAVAEHFAGSDEWIDKHIIVTAGPTYEPIDPVRFIGNHSSGKMGFAIAEAAANLGAKVTLVSGPTHLGIDHPLVETVRVNTALEMKEALDQRFDDASAVIMSAAVADYRPAQSYSSKQKKEGSPMNAIPLVENPDILKSLGERKSHQKLVGFALETDDELANGEKKLRTKKLDLLVLNSLNDQGAGFGVDTNKVTLITSSGNQALPLKSKSQVAVDILEALGKLWST